MAAFSCLRVAVCVSAPVILQCHGIAPQGHHGRWHAAGTSPRRDLVAGAAALPGGRGYGPRRAFAAPEPDERASG